MTIFGHLLGKDPDHLAENAYVDRLDPYLQLFYRHQGLKNTSSDVKIGSKSSKMAFLRVLTIFGHLLGKYATYLAENADLDR